MSSEKFKIGDKIKEIKAMDGDKWNWEYDKSLEKIIFFGKGIYKKNLEEDVFFLVKKY